MQYRQLGNTGIRVSLLALGTGGASQFGQNTGLDARGRRRLVAAALDAGINFFDTAEAYGDSEQELGAALKGVPKDKYLVATKWSHKNASGWRDPEDLVASTERSLGRLGTDTIDVMQFHGILPGDYDTVVDRYYPVMERLIGQGKVRFAGFTQMMRKDPTLTVVTEALTKHPELWHTVMLKYGILNQWAAKEVLPLAERHGVGILNMAPVRFTLTRPAALKELFDGWRNDGSVDISQLDPDDPFGWLVHNGVDSVISAGYRFAAMPPAISTVITGTSSVEHLEANVRSLEHPALPAEDHRRLVKLLGNSAAPN